MTEIHHIALPCNDLAAMLRFYQGVLGLGWLRSQRHADGTIRSHWLDLEGAILMLEQAPSPVVVPVVTHFVLALRIDPTQRANKMHELSARGVLITHETPHSFYFNDPEGHALAFSHYPDAGLPD